MTEHRIDILISRIVDKVETTVEWNEFRSLAAGEPSAWELLAEAQRDNDRLQELANLAVDVADDVALPVNPMPSRSQLLRRAFSSGLGWAVAASILLAWVTSGPFRPFDSTNARNNPMQSAGLLSTDGAWDNYLDRSEAEGTLVGEIEPKVLLNSKQRPDGSLEVTFMRQVIERRTVPVLVRPGYDDLGRVTPIVVRPATRGSL
jgi:hypothetical protein